MASKRVEEMHRYLIHPINGNLCFEFVLKVALKTNQPCICDRCCPVCINEIAVWYDNMWCSVMVVDWLS